MSQFYALMHDNTVKYISLKEDIVTDIRNLFINGGAKLKPEGIEEDIFDGNIVSRNGENITYVNYNLPEDFLRVPDNQADMSEYNINEDVPKSIFYYVDGKFYFQIFNKKNMLQRKMVLQLFEYGNVFTKGGFYKLINSSGSRSARLNLSESVAHPRTSAIDCVRLSTH